MTKNQETKDTHLNQWWQSVEFKNDQIQHVWFTEIFKVQEHLDPWEKSFPAAMI